MNENSSISETDQQKQLPQSETSEEPSDTKASGRGVTGSTLKIIAMAAMLIDHIGAGFLEKGYLPFLLQKYGLESNLYNNWYTVDLLLRCIGRLAFPIFCFLLVEGFCHTRNVWKYLGRLFVFAIISEVPFDLAFMKSAFDWSYQNVFFTLFLGLLSITLYQKAYDPAYKMPEMARRLLSCLAVVVCGVLAIVLHTDYDCTGVFVIVIFYLFRNNELVRDIVGAIALLGAGTVEIAGYVAFLPMHFYNGKRGLNLKYVFYLFYPVHLLIIAGIRMWMFGV